jgi:hypothetical protein
MGESHLEVVREDWMLMRLPVTDLDVEFEVVFHL